MSFEFKCPNCSYLITEKDFKENEKVLSHLNETFKQHRTEYIQVLKAKMEEHYQKEQQDKIQLALVEKENQLNKSFQLRIDDLNKTISGYEGTINNNKNILEKTLAEHELKINEQKQSEIITLKTQIKELESNTASQEAILKEKFATQLLAKENQLNKSFQVRIDDLNKIISGYETTINNNKSILEKSLVEKELEIIKQKNIEIENLKNQISELKEASMQFKVIQNKTKGENFEHEIEGELRKVFEPDDVISKITSQDKKADYLQKVRQDNIVIGKIVYEVKNAEWSNNWEKKLVDDMAKQNSKYGILVATSFNSKYHGIPFKRSDYNANIYLCDSESFYFVGQILRTLIKMEHRLESSRNQKDYNEKIKQFNEWTTTQLPKLHLDIKNRLDQIENLARLITDRAEDIKTEKEKVYKNWIENIKDYLEKFMF